jgi:hypothetical protein
MAEEVTLYLDTSGVYHTDAEVAQNAQDILNNIGGEKEASEDLESLVKSAAQSGTSKYWKRLSQLASNNDLASKANRTNGVEMFTDIFNKDFSTIWKLAMSIAEHRYELPVDIEWQKESDRSKNHINTETFTYYIRAAMPGANLSIAPKLIIDEADFIRLTTLDGVNLYDVRKNAEGNFIVREVIKDVIQEDTISIFDYDAERAQPFSNFTVGKVSYYLVAEENGGSLERVASAAVKFEPAE